MGESAMDLKPAKHRIQQDPINPSHQDGHSTALLNYTDISKTLSI